MDRLVLLRPGCQRGAPVRARDRLKRLTECVIVRFLHLLHELLLARVEALVPFLRL